MREERELIAAFGRLAHDYDRENVIGAAGNILLNALRQEHKTLGAAQEHLRDLYDRMQEALTKKHYHEDGTRNDRRITLPPLTPEFFNLR